ECETAVRRHPMGEGGEIAGVRFGRLTAGRQSGQIVVVPVQPLPAGDQLQAAEEQVEAVRVLRSARLRMGVERALRHRVTGDEEEVAAVLIAGPLPQRSLVTR